jgi:hypothetical protein
VLAVTGNTLPALLVKEIEGVQMLIIRGAYDSEENHMQFRHVNMTADMFTGLTNTLVENGDSFDMIKDLDSV